MDIPNESGEPVESQEISTTSPFKLRVYIEDTDAGGVVYYANYLKFMERARTEFIRRQGLDKKSMHELNIQFVVRRAEVEYCSPAYLDDLLQVEALPSAVSRCAVTFTQDITRRRDQLLLCKARVQVVCVDMQRLRPCPLPASIFSASSVDLYQIIKNTPATKD